MSAGGEARDPVSENLPRNRDYAVVRVPDLLTVTPGAEIRYECVAREGKRPEALGGRSPYRDSVNWYKFREQALVEETRARDPAWGRPVEKGPLGQFFWRCTWNEPPGRYVVGAEVRRGADPTFCFLPQYVESAGLVLRRAMGELAGGRWGGSASGSEGIAPEEAERKVVKLLANLEAIAKRRPPRDARARREHEESLQRWRRYGDELRALLAPTNKRRRIAVRAVHIEAASQLRRSLLLFLAHVGDETTLTGAKRERWVLVDWTDPTDPRFHGSYQGTGATADEAIRGALADWDWGNCYPAGRLVCDVPAAATGGRAFRHEMATDGKTIADEVRGVLEWIAVGTMVVAGVVLLFTPLEPLATGALAASLVSSTGAATIAVAERHRQGIFDWRADGIDALTIIGNLFGGPNIWTRGARVRGLFGDGADRIFFGAQIGTDLVQGLLVAESHVRDLEALLEDPELSPEERHRRLLELFRSAAAATALTYFSLRSSAGALSRRGRRSRHFPDNPRTRPPEERIDDLTNPRATVDATDRPPTEGHTNKPHQQTDVETGIPHHARRANVEETEFAHYYTVDKHPWELRHIDDKSIVLIDKDGFSFDAKCIDGTLSVTIITSIDPETAEPYLLSFFPWAKKKEYSKVLWASVLFEKMYAHFEQVGNPVKRLQGSWAWDNYRAAKKKYDELRGPPKRLSPDEAAKIAVQEAGTYVKYHKPRGFTKVVSAKHVESIKQFEFLIEWEPPKDATRAHSGKHSSSTSKHGD